MLVSGRVDTPGFCFDTSGNSGSPVRSLDQFSLCEVPPWDDSKIKELEDVAPTIFATGLVGGVSTPLCGWWIVKGIHQKMLAKIQV